VTPAEILERLAQINVTIVAGPSLDDPGHHLDDSTLLEARHHRPIFAWAIEGSRTGHAWHACDRCSEMQLIKKGRQCHMTPGCVGDMRPVGPRVLH
jgi:hypothetical protein